MRDTWRRARFREVLTPAGEKVNVSDIDYVPYAGVRLNAGGVYAREVVPAKEVKARTLTRITKGHIVYNRMWATKGSFGVVDEEADGCLVTNDFPVFEADISHLLPGYCRLIFATPWFQFEAAARAAGTTERRRLKEDAFLDIEVLLPSVEEQRRIVDLISSIDQAVERGGRLEQQLDAVRGQLLADVLSPREGWQETTVGEIADINPEATRRWPADRRIRYMDLSSVVATEGIRLDAVREMEYGSAPSRARRVVRAGDVLVATVRPYLRGFAQVPEELDGEVASTGFAVLRAKNEIDPGFIWALVQADDFVEFLMTRATGSNYPAVRPADIAEYSVAVPPLEEQQRIGALLAGLNQTLTQLRKEISRLKILRTQVSQDLLAGVRQIPDSYDRFLEKAS